MHSILRSEVRKTDAVGASAWHAAGVPRSLLYCSVSRGSDRWRFCEIENREAKSFGDLVWRDVSTYYPGTEQNYGEYFYADQSVELIDGRFRRKRSVWAIYVGDTPVAFCGLTRKSGGVGKIGPLVTRLEFRNLGFGRLLMQEVEQKCINEDVHKLFMTAPLINETVLSFAVKIGFKIEGRLRQHYTSLNDELVLAKLLSARGLALPSLSNSTRSAVGVGESHSIRSSRPTPASALRTLVGERFDRGQLLQLHAKRGGAIKVEVDHWSREVITEMFKVENLLRGTEVRKLYALTTEQVPEHAYVLGTLGFETEASFSSACGRRDSIRLLAKSLRT